MLMISDLFSMLHLGNMQLSQVFDYSETIRNETNLYVVSEFLHNMKYIHYLVIDMEEINKKLQVILL